MKGEYSIKTSLEVSILTAIYRTLMEYGGRVSVRELKASIKTKTGIPDQVIAEELKRLLDQGEPLPCGCCLIKCRGTKKNSMCRIERVEEDPKVETAVLKLELG